MAHSDLCNDFENNPFTIPISQLLSQLLIYKHISEYQIIQLFNALLIKMQDYG